MLSNKKKRNSVHCGRIELLIILNYELMICVEIGQDIHTHFEIAGNEADKRSLNNGVELTHCCWTECMCQWTDPRGFGTIEFLRWSVSCNHSIREKR